MIFHQKGVIIFQVALFPSFLTSFAYVTDEKPSGGPPVVLECL